jgi:hypothetical protein
MGQRPSEIDPVSIRHAESSTPQVDENGAIGERRAYASAGPRSRRNQSRRSQHAHRIVQSRLSSIVSFRSDQTLGSVGLLVPPLHGQG